MKRAALTCDPYTKNFEELSTWIRVSEEKLSTQQTLTGKII